MAKRMTQDEFINKCIQVHGLKYDYSKVQYVNGDTKVIIICPKHGEFLQRANCHTNDKQGCPECAKLQRKETCKKLYGHEIVACSEESIKKSREACREKFGGNSPFCSKEVREKAKETIINKYGVEHITQNDEIKCRIKETNLERYGHPCSAQNPNVKAKQIMTMIERYGVSNAFQSPAIRAKIINIWQKKYGCDNPMKNEDVRKKVEETCLKRYGKKHISQVEEIQNKAKQTMLQRFGVENPMQSDDIKQKAQSTNLVKYGVKNPLQNPHVRHKALQTMVYKFGTQYPYQNADIMRTMLDKKRENGTFNASKAEESLYEMLCDKFGQDDVIRQHISHEYPFRCDFYITSRNMYIELNAFCSHGGHWFDACNQDDIKRLEVLRQLSSVKHSDFYKNIIKNWCEKDVLKREIARSQKLNYVVFWETDLRDAMLWFETGCPDREDWQ
jgi:hypothetical protein